MGFESMLETIYPTFDQMKWTVVRASDDLRFLTGDSPVTWIDPTLPPPFCYGLQARHIEVPFPVGPKVLLLGTWEGSDISTEANDPMVREFNTRRAFFADRYVYANSQTGVREALEVRTSRKEKAASN